MGRKWPKICNSRLLSTIVVSWCFKWLCMCIHLRNRCGKALYQLFMGVWSPSGHIIGQKWPKMAQNRLKSLIYGSWVQLWCPSVSNGNVCVNIFLKGVPRRYINWLYVYGVFQGINIDQKWPKKAENRLKSVIYGSWVLLWLLVAMDVYT